MKRRGLSGIFIFEKFKDEDTYQPTAFEDCTEATQDRVLDSLDTDSLKSLAKVLATTIRQIGEQFNLTTYTQETEDEQI